MTTMEYLGQIGRLDKMIRNKLTEIAQLKELSYGIGAICNTERVQKTPEHDKIGATLVKIEEMEEALNQIVHIYLEKKAAIIFQIDQLEDKVFYEVLFSRYIEKKTFEKIAEDTNYSFRNISRLHKKALQQFEKIYGEEYLHQQNLILQDLA